MAEFRVTHRPAVNASFASRTGAVSIEPRPEGHVIQVLGRMDKEDLAPMLLQAGGSDANAVRKAGPGQWFLVGDAPLSRADLQELLARIEPHASCVDQSHGRVRIAIGGKAVSGILRKGTAVDLDILAVGQSAMTLIGHISVHMTRTGVEAFELMVLRGFAESLWDELVRMSAEFG